MIKERIITLINRLKHINNFIKVLFVKIKLFIHYEEGGGRKVILQEIYQNYIK